MQCLSFAAPSAGCPTPRGQALCVQPRSGLTFRPPESGSGSESGSSLCRVIVGRFAADMVRTAAMGHTTARSDPKPPKPLQRGEILPVPLSLQMVRQRRSVWDPTPLSSSVRVPGCQVAFWPGWAIFQPWGSLTYLDDAATVYGWLHCLGKQVRDGNNDARLLAGGSGGRWLVTSYFFNGHLWDRNSSLVGRG